MSNFAFLPADFATLREAAQAAEGHIHGDPRAACFHTRFALEAAVHWLYRHDKSLRMPYERSLGALLHEPSFQNLLPEKIFQKARAILTLGNQAVHNQRPVRPLDALRVVKELHHLGYWLARTYTPDAPRDGAAWRDERVPRPARAETMVPRRELEAREAELAEKNAELLRLQQEQDAKDAELQQLRDRLTDTREHTVDEADPHDYTEAETRQLLIDLELRRAGWPLDHPRDREVPVRGMPTPSGQGKVDYVLWGDDGKPLAVVEAKRTTADPKQGREQAKRYADSLEAESGQRPLIFYTNGYETWLWDDTDYPPRQVAGFYTKDELDLLIRRRASREPLDVRQIDPAITDRYYQQRALGHLFDHFATRRRKALLVMATGTGKTRTAISLVDVMNRANWLKRALFLADRRSLVKQATNAFKRHLPDLSPVNLVTEKGKQGKKGKKKKDGEKGRVYVSTYATMMGLIDQTDGGVARFGVGHFDLVILDEAHRSVYQKYREIFRYFDAHLVGLTATPSDQVGRDTYALFDLESGTPTDAYELETAVDDGYLVPPSVEEVDLRFPRQGIAYADLSPEEQEQWESLDWGDNAPAPGTPQQIDATAINRWLFNKDTVDKVLEHLMEHGHKVEAGDRLGKTILFARNHRHADFIAERFDRNYPQYAGHFARVIDNYETQAEALIDDFSRADKAPHLAISVDMLDTGIDVPEVVNLVFFKPVYSKIKFWQMIGRGTRLCENLFGPGLDKENFKVFDFCGNFQYFGERPEGVTSSSGTPLGTRLFRARVQLLDTLGRATERDPEGALRSGLGDKLHAAVAAMTPENFMVRRHLETVEQFQRRSAWDALDSNALIELHDNIARLPGKVPRDPVESRIFDLDLLRMQLALADGEAAPFERYRRKVVEIAALLEDKPNIPKVKAQLEYLAQIQESHFWEEIDLAGLETLRQRLRALVPVLDKKQQSLVYSDFVDEVLEVRRTEVVPMPRMTGAQYEKKVQDYLRNHRDHLVIHRLRSNQPLTPTDLESLEAMLVEIGEDDGERLLAGLLERRGNPSLPIFVRGLVGMDRRAAQEAFAQFLQDRSLSAQQIRFVEMIVDQLTERGVIEPGALYEIPFTDLHHGGPEGLFAGRDNVLHGIFQTLAAVQPDTRAEAS